MDPEYQRIQKDVIVNFDEDVNHSLKRDSTDPKDF